MKRLNSLFASRKTTSKYERPLARRSALSNPYVWLLSLSVPLSMQFFASAHADTVRCGSFWYYNASLYSEQRIVGATSAQADVSGNSYPSISVTQDANPDYVQVTLTTTDPITGKNVKDCAPSGGSYATWDVSANIGEFSTTSTSQVVYWSTTQKQWVAVGVTSQTNDSKTYTVSKSAVNLWARVNRVTLPQYPSGISTVYQQEAWIKLGGAQGIQPGWTFDPDVDPIQNIAPIPQAPYCTEGCCSIVPVSPQEQSCTSTDGADPVDSLSGNYYFHDTDLSVSNIMPIRMIRSYASGENAKIGPFGVGTNLSTYNISLTVTKDAAGKPVLAPNTTLLVDLGKGAPITFTNGAAGGATFTSPGSIGAASDVITLNLDGNGYLDYATYKKLSGAQLFFDGDGRYIKLEDEHGNYLMLNRDAQGRLTSVADPNTGRSVTLTYNGDGLISQIADHAGRTVSYTYSAAKELLTVTNPANSVMTYTWTADHRIATKEDYNNQIVATNVYDPTTGSVTQQTNAVGVVYKFSAPQGDDRRWVFLPDGAHREFEFNAHGMPTELTDANGNATTISYSPNLFTSSTTGRYIQRTDPMGRVTRTDFNGNNLPTTITFPDNTQVVITYDGSHPDRPASVRDPLWHYTYFTYDAQGNLTELKDNDNQTTTFTYNSKGQVLTRTNALGKTTTYAYNASNELASVTDPLNNVTAFTYDTLGRMLSVTDPRQNVTTFVYDTLDRLTSVTDPLNQTTSYTYDNNGNLLTVTDANNHTTTYAYDAENRLTSVTNPLNQTTAYTYNGLNQVATALDPKSQTTTYAHDAEGRLTSVNYNGQKVYAMTYDADDELTTIADGVGTWSYAYNTMGRVTSFVTPQGTLSYTYNDNGLPLTMGATGYPTVSYGYDLLDRLHTITQNSQTFTYDYDALGRRTQLTRPNGVTSYYYYDDDSRLSALVHKKDGGAQENNEYVYDPSGNITQYSRYLYGAADKMVRNYSYDALNRLTHAEGLGIIFGASSFANQSDQDSAINWLTQAQQTSDPAVRETDLQNAETLGATLAETATWTFDPVGNIASKAVRPHLGGLATTTYAHNAADRLTTLTPPVGSAITYTYDANGNMTGDSTGRTLTWNALDQLTALSASGVSATFSYDPLGRRVSFVKNSQTKTYLYDGLDMLSDGASQFLNGVGIDEPLTITTGATTQTYLGDHLGSTSWLSDANGAFQTRYDYSSYGKLEGGLANPSAVNNFSYTGREDDGTGLMYYRARYYDPSLEIFISDDPLGDAQRYVGGNPVSFVDPLGLEGKLNLNSPVYDSWLYQKANQMPELKKSYLVFVHSGPNEVGEYFTNKQGNKDFRFIPLKNLVAMMKADPDFEKNDSITLYGCRSGSAWEAKNGIPIAQKIANLTGKTVFAPNGYVTFGSDGKPRINLYYRRKRLGEIRFENRGGLVEYGPK